jgi:hypothetical protein
MESGNRVFPTDRGYVLQAGNSSHRREINILAVAVVKNELDYSILGLYIAEAARALVYPREECGARLCLCDFNESNRGLFGAVLEIEDKSRGSMGTSRQCDETIRVPTLEEERRRVTCTFSRSCPSWLLESQASFRFTHRRLSSSSSAC